MATVYSLVCFGGRAGKTVTMTIASPCVVSLAYHGLRDGTGVVFTTSGALPTGVTSGTTYYSRSTATGTLNLYDTAANAIAGGSTGRVITTGSQSGTHTIKSDYWVNTLDATAKLRYGAAGSERSYAGIAAWISARTSAPAGVFDYEIAELGEAFTEWTAGNTNCNIPCGASLITSMVDGARSAAWHAGDVSGATGYVINRYTTAFVDVLTLSGAYTACEGFVVQDSLGTYQAFGLGLTGLGSTGNNMIVLGAATDQSAYGIFVNAYVASIRNCFVANWHYGIRAGNFQNGMLIGNCTATKNAVGFDGTASSYGYIYSNLSVGNTTNWTSFTPNAAMIASANAGLSGEAWMTTGGTRVTVATTDFANYAGGDYRPANGSSPQVDSAAQFYGALEYDLADDERPNYNSGGAEAFDIGCFEFDHGVPRPETHTIDFSGLVAGSQVVVCTTGTQTELFRDNSSGTTESYDAAAAGVTVDYTVMKAGYLPLRATGIALTAESTTVAVVQLVDRSYVASSGLQIYGGSPLAGNATVNTGTKVFSVDAATTVQNWYSFMIESWIAQSSLVNVTFPLKVNGPNSVTLDLGWEWRGWASSQTQGTGIANTSLALLSRDGMRYVAANGTTVNAIWDAILTLDTEAGLQVKYRQATAGAITSANNTGPMDQLVQVYGGSSYGNFDYRDHMVLKVQKVGYSQPKPDLVAIYGNLEDQFYVTGLDPELQYTTTNAAVADIAQDNTAKTIIVSATRSILEIYQDCQYWANQDAQWDADNPLTANTGGTTFTIYTGWTLSGMNYVTGTQTLTGGTITLAGPGTYAPRFSATTLTAQGEGTYVLIATSSIITFAPTAGAVTYVLGEGTFGGTIDLRNTHASRAITIELPSGTTYTTANNTGAAITVTLPQLYQSVTITGLVANSRVQIYDTALSGSPPAATELYNGVVAGTSITWTDSVAAAADRTIRVRIACYVAPSGSPLSSSTAYEFVDANIGTSGQTAGTAAVSYLANQAADATYNANAIDGATVTGITIEPSPARVKIGIAGGAVTWPQIYAYQVYWLYGAIGIADEASFIEATDTANYLVTDFDIKNTHANPLTITGGWGRDSVTLTVAGCIDSAGSTGNIYAEPDHVVAYATGSGLTAGQSAELTAAASSAATAATNASTAASSAASAATAAAAVPAAVLAAATAAPIAANVKKVNSITVNGSGTAADPWGP